jgi:peptidoglycan/LPS O-acetylase OafA/YrhL
LLELSHEIIATHQKAFIIIGGLLLVASIIFLRVGLDPRTPQPAADLLVSTRVFIAVVGALLISLAVVMKLHMSKWRLLLIPLCMTVLLIITAIIMVFAVAGVVSNNY